MTVPFLAVFSRKGSVGNPLHANIGYRHVLALPYIWGSFLLQVGSPERKDLKDTRVQVRIVMKRETAYRESTESTN